MNKEEIKKVLKKLKFNFGKLTDAEIDYILDALEPKKPVCLGSMR